MTKLGRGLEALINTGPHSFDKETGVTTLNISEIEPNRFQPRRKFNKEKLQELAESLRENGIIQPIIVTRIEESLYEIIAGERRLEASKLAGFKEIPVIIRSVTPREQLQFAIIENVQREDLNPIELAIAYQQLNDEFNLTHSQISAIVGKERATISNNIRLLKLNEKIRDMILNDALSSGHARAILQVDERFQEKFADHIFKNKLSVRKSEIEARKIKERGSVIPKKINPATPTKFTEQEYELTRKYKTRVKISEKNNKGKIVFYFSNSTELNELLTKLE